MNLIIVESPTKAKTLGKFLGKDYQVEATMGHIKDLPKSTLGVDVEHNFKPEFVVVPKREETIKILQRRSKKAKKIYLATDPDREGEAIAIHARQLIGNSNTSRIVFHEITKEAVSSAIKNPRAIDSNLVDAQIARRVLDRLVGYKLSPLLWKKVRRGLSAGRVQTVAVRLIVEKEREIEKFKPQEYWEIFVILTNTKSEKLQLQLVNTKIENKKLAYEITNNLKKSKYIVLDVKKKTVSKNPYPPFTTSTMTQAAAGVFGWSSKRTMRVAQNLYEHGLITYHRTDSLTLAGAAVDAARGFIKAEYGDKYLPDSPRFYKTTSKSAQEAHEAIRPTNVNKKVKIQGDGQKLYNLVWNRFVACQMSASIYDETKIDVEATNSKKYLLRVNGQIMKFDGWRKLFPKGTDGSIELPEVAIGEKLDLEKVRAEQKFTQPPARFNEASLIKTLEKLGIGRPSTYAPTISTIQIRSYVEKNEGKFFATPVGMAVSDFLVGNFPNIFDYEFTAGMEDGLDKIAQGEGKWVKTIKDFWNPFDKHLKSVTKNSKRVKIAAEKLGKKCPDCKKGELVIRIGRFGKFISCSRFPDCKHTEKYIEKIGVKCPECTKGDAIYKKSSKGKRFFGCSRYPECKWASWRKPVKESKKAT
ncbi:type I DNA topoisomerase [Patescibacteria group bacterium]